MSWGSDDGDCGSGGGGGGLCVKWKGILWLGRGLPQSLSGKSTMNC